MKSFNNLCFTILTIYYYATTMTTTTATVSAAREGISVLSDEQQVSEEEKLALLVTTEFHNNHVKPIRVYFLDPTKKEEEEKLVLEIATGQRVALQSHPGHMFVVYDMGGIRRDTLIVTAEYGDNQIFEIRNYEMTEVIFHNNISIQEGEEELMEVYWINEEDQEEVFKGKTERNGGRIRLDTHTGHTFAAYNNDRSFRMQFVVTAESGESQLFVFENSRVLLSFHNNLSKQQNSNSVVHLFWVETIFDNKGQKNENTTTLQEQEQQEDQQQDSSNHLRHPVGVVPLGHTVQLHSDSHHTFQAFDTDEEGNLKDLLGEYLVTEHRGGKQRFTIEDDEL